MRVYLFIVVLMALSSSSDAKPDPLMVLYTKQGFVENMLQNDDIGPIIYAHKLLFEHIGLPDNLLYSPFARAQNILENNQPACVLFMRKTQEREARYLFSEAIAFSMGQRLYQSIYSAPLAPSYLNASGAVVSIAKLLNDRPYEHIIALPETSYGDVLDSQLAQIKESQKVRSYIGDYHSSQAQLFFRGRAHFALIISSQVSVYLQTHPDAEYRSYPVADATVPITVHIMCNNTEESQNWLTQVNSAMAKVYRDTFYLKAYERLFLGDELAKIAAFIEQKTLE